MLDIEVKFPGGKFPNIVSAPGDWGRSEPPGRGVSWVKAGVASAPTSAELHLSGNHT